jgi:AAA domain (dynein-related subfamily)
MSSRSGRNKSRNQQQGRAGIGRQNGQGTARPGTAARKGPLLTPPKEIAKAVLETRNEAAEAAGGSLPDPGPVPEGTDTLSVIKLWEEVAQVKAAFTAGSEQAAAKKEELGARERDVIAAETSQRDVSARIAEQETDLRRRAAKADERDAGLAELEVTLAAREEEAKTRAIGDVRDALKQAREELDAQRAEVADERARIRERGIEMERMREDLEDTKQLYDQRLKDKVSQEIEHHELRMQLLERRSAELLADNQRLQEELADYDRARRAQPGGDYDPGQLLEDLQRLKDENRELRAQQAPADLMADLDRLRDAEQTWREDRTLLLQETELLNRQLASFHISAFERDRLEHVNAALQATAEAYKDEVERLREQADGLRQRAEGASPFPQCSKMDDKYGGARDGLRDDVIPLHAFVLQVRDFLAQQHELYYSETDLRAFVAGMAATKLHILQGVSGIGKTQLPLQFAEAIGATAVTVAVGADWRTPQELTGYYNAFERRFYESDFTQAVYQANCPQFQHQPFFVVLDEMNLSHPEQYFSDVLSILERKKDQRLGLTLMTAEVTPSPKLLRDGRRLLLPNNIWFVGTANQDETTVGFAEKTLDRSNVLELPPRPERFNPPPADVPPVYSLTAWKTTFRQAAETHQVDAARVNRFLQGELATRLHADFRIAPGPRTLKQLGDFVPAFVAAGGAVGEAADHVLAMKVLRKIRGRYEFRRDKIAAFRDELPNFWRGLGDCGLDRPERSIQLLNDELHERGEN